MCIRDRGSDVDVVLLQLGIKQQALLRPAICGLFLFLRRGPLAVAQAEEQEALALGGHELFGGDRFAIDHAQVAAGGALTAAGVLARGRKVGGEGNNRGDDDNDPEPFLVPSDCANHTKFKNSERAP